jgi:pimeloyl-ACP methyl ester carboxylesterase
MGEMKPPIRYARTRDGVDIAFTVSGEGEGPPLVCMPPLPFSHAEAGWRVPALRRWYERLGRGCRLVLYDARGTGLSAQASDEFGMPSMVADLEAVLDAVGLERAAIASFFNSGPVGIRFASLYPDRVTHLAMWGGFARGRDVIVLPFSEEAPGLVEPYWRALTEAAARVWCGTAGEEARQLGAYFRECAAPHTAFRAFLAARDYDVTADLAHVQAPTLVLHRRGAEPDTTPVAAALAAGIPGARLELLDGDAAAMFAGDIEPPACAIEAFIGAAPGARAEAAATVDVAAMAQALSAREREVLHLLCSGRSNKEIARTLDLSINTVERHLTNIYRKLGVRSRSEVLARVLNGVTEPPTH